MTRPEVRVISDGYDGMVTVGGETVPAVAASIELSVNNKAKVTVEIDASSVWVSTDKAEYTGMEDIPSWVLKDVLRKRGHDRP